MIKVGECIVVIIYNIFKFGFCFEFILLELLIVFFNLISKLVFKEWGFYDVWVIWSFFEEDGGVFLV